MGKPQESSIIKSQSFERRITTILASVNWGIVSPIDSIQRSHSWDGNIKGCEKYFDLKPRDEWTAVIRKGMGQRTVSLRTKKSYSKNLNIWRICYPRHLRGSHAGVGVGTQKAGLSKNGYVSLIGGPDNKSWGIDLMKKTALHNGQEQCYPNFVDRDFFMPDTFYMCLDMDMGILAFWAEGRFLGVAASNLKCSKPVTTQHSCVYTLDDHHNELFPMVSSVVENSEISIFFVGGGMDTNSFLQMCQSPQQVDQPKRQRADNSQQQQQQQWVYTHDKWTGNIQIQTLRKSKRLSA